MTKNSSGTSLLILILFPLLFSSCGKETPESLPDSPVAINLNADQISLIESGNAFAFDVFKEISANSVNSANLIISPSSISTSLSMTLNGAAGETRTAMVDALRIKGLTPEIINKSYKDLSQTLLSVDKRVLISLANSVWIENNFIAKKSFIDILTNFYNADSRAFKITDPLAPKQINNWIESETNGLIKDMVGPLDDNTVMLLINAIYFKGKWKSEFDKSKTVLQQFYKSDGSGTMVPMMKQIADFKVYTGDSFVLAEFPYGQGNFVMDVIVPNDKNGADAIIPALDSKNYNRWIAGMSERKTALSFPKFKYGYKSELKYILSDMGMGIAFSDAADFSNISSDYNLLISSVLHQACIETNEEGTEAAAATVVIIGTTSAGPSEPLVLDLDHPFLYIIRETTTNSILFMGKVADPMASE